MSQLDDIKNCMAFSTRPKNVHTKTVNVTLFVSWLCSRCRLGTGSMSVSYPRAFQTRHQVFSPVHSLHRVVCVKSFRHISTVNCWRRRVLCQIAHIKICCALSLRLVCIAFTNSERRVRGNASVVSFTGWRSVWFLVVSKQALTPFGFQTTEQ